ncbi:MAG: S1/P1 Nuclease [Bacteroidales bacterium]|nr:S1/P1 Nuclease [Bacteroidales bacterium]
MKRFVLAFAFGLMVCVTASGWGREGHETIAKIADRNLKPSVRKKVESYLGHSIVYYAKWMDDYRHTQEYGFTSPWHACTVDEDLKYVPQPEGDAVYGINYAMENLKDYRNLPDSAVVVNIKYLLHLAGDLHCPAHVAYQGRDYSFQVDFGGGYIKPRVKTNIHGVWDYLAIQSCRIWSVSDYAHELDRLPKKDIREIAKGTPQDWLEESAERCLLQFELAHPEDRLQQDFVNAAMPLIETQMLYAGYRLAHILNSIF